MRLVDADVLTEYLDKRRTYETMNGRNKAYAKGVRDAMKDIDNAPTIPAIPAEWLWKVRNDNRLTIDDVETIDLILAWWQKEQVAKPLWEQWLEREMKEAAENG